MMRLSAKVGKYGEKVGEKWQKMEIAGKKYRVTTNAAELCD
jgi:hypothetical protein